MCAVSDRAEAVRSAPVSDLPSPPAARLRPPRWLDTRLLTGLLLVLGSVVLGAKIVAEADDAQPVWALKRNLAAGTTLTADDLVVRQVRIDAGRNPYLAASGESPVGRQLTRDLEADELVPYSAVVTGGGDHRLVTVPVEQHHLPPGLLHGQRVDVYVTVKPRAATTVVKPRLVVREALVQRDVASEAGRFSAGTGRLGVVVSVPAGEVADLVAAVESGVIDLVRVP
jgi:SAF domain-containing protein